LLIVTLFGGAWVLNGLIGAQGVWVSGVTTEVAIEHEHVDQGFIARHELSDGRNRLVPVEFLNDNVVAREGLVQAGEGVHGALVDVTVKKTASRAIVGIGWLLGLTLAWVAVLNLRDFVDSNLQGLTFSSGNALRLKRIGQAALAAAVLSVGWHRVLNLTLDDATSNVIGFEATPILSGGAIWIVVGLTFFAIATAFERGVELRELDLATI